MAINFTLIITKFQAVIDLPTIVSVFFLVVLFFLLKLILIKLLGFFFKVKDLAKLAIFFSLLFDKTLGFVLFPLVVVIYFFSVDISSTVLMISLGLFIILFMLKLFWLWKIGTNSFGLPQVYIFLYLCSIEIFPLLLLVKGIFI